MNVAICYNTNMDFDPIKFRDFIRDKFAEWRGKGRETIADYSKSLGVSQQVLSNWYNGGLKERPNPKLYNLLIAEYGEEVYDVLGLPRPASDSLEGFPPALRLALEEASGKIIKLGVKGDSPEAIAIIDEAMKKSGYRLISTTEDDSSA
jgi:hypothetical protein